MLAESDSAKGDALLGERRLPDGLNFNRVPIEHANAEGAVGTRASSANEL